MIFLKARLSLIAIGAVAMCTLGTPALRAQASRTWVSGVGDDANPCSRTAPCKTFAGAISKTAAAGEINIIDPAGYGGVTITKSITINGGGSFASILVSGTNGVIVNVGASDVVTIRNVSINGLGTGLSGIKMLGSGSLFVENVDIHQFTDKGIDFQPTGAAQLFVTNAAIRNTGGGILVKPAAGISTTAQVRDSILEQNVYGIRAEDRSSVSIERSTAAGNLNNGFLAISASQAVQMTIDSSIASNNRNPSSSSSGIHSNGALSTIRISNVVVTNNDIGLTLAGGSVASWGNNKIAGNNLNGAPNSSLSQQ
jgi:parallel beta helix pectate lyase-like protein